MKTILITGGAGFVGSNLAIHIKRRYPDSNVIAFDNLKRRGSELNIPRLASSGVRFIHGDVRLLSDLADVGKFDLMIECSAEPSVLAGFGSSPNYMLDTNLQGLVNCLNKCREYNSKIIFLSSSRVYPYDALNKQPWIEDETRYKYDYNAAFNLSCTGVPEDFTLTGVRSLYGATKLASELIINEYCSMYGLEAIINRCGVIAGPWQFGKVDQGVVTHWVMAHIHSDCLKYIGYGGNGKQVRDMLHVDDLFDAIVLQIQDFSKYDRQTFNLGGGYDVSSSLLELTGICQKVTGNIIKIASLNDERPADLRIFVTDSSKFRKLSGWEPSRNVEDIVRDIYEWLIEYSNKLRTIATIT